MDLVSTTVVSTRILRPWRAPFCCAIVTSRSCNWAMTPPPKGLGNAGQRRCIGHFAQPNARELTIRQVHSHFAFQGLETPVAYVLQQQEPQCDFGRCLVNLSVQSWNSLTDWCDCGPDQTRPQCWPATSKPSQ